MLKGAWQYRRQQELGLTFLWWCGGLISLDSSYLIGFDQNALCGYIFGLFPCYTFVGSINCDLKIKNVLICVNALLRVGHFICSLYYLFKSQRQSTGIFQLNQNIPPSVTQIPEVYSAILIAELLTYLSLTRRTLWVSLYPLPLIFQNKYAFHRP